MVRFQGGHPPAAGQRARLQRVQHRGRQLSRATLGRAAGRRRAELGRGVPDEASLEHLCPSSVVFGVYHWFSYEVFGSRLVLMAYIFLVTGAGGWMFSYAFAKTKSLYAPTGLHLGWNLVSAVVFSSGPLGNQLLLQQGEEVAWNEWYTLVFFLLQTLVAPGIVT